MPDDPRNTPTVFLSYSYDSREHKSWVAKLATDLMDQGVNVIFDQWDLGPGDDVPKFMERGLTEADRVLMVCTASYTRKADDGAGGVGYEAMIVTGELVQNLGTNKFIPVVRQPGAHPKARPVCVNTRKYIDLSDEESSAENFAELIEALHRVQASKKPPLGPSPFAPGEFESDAKKATRSVRTAQFSEILSSPEATLDAASNIIRDNDQGAWRKLLLAATDLGAAKAIEWRGNNRAQPSFEETQVGALFEDLHPALDGYAPFIACMLAAAGSNDDSYATQLGWVDNIYSPRNWNDTGGTYFVRLPATVLFVAQALIGGMLMQSGRGKAAYDLAKTKVTDKYERNSPPIFLHTEVNGWLDCLNHHCTTSWSFLDSLIAKWDWLREAFGSLDECRASVTSYYLLMNVLNFIVDATSTKRETFRTTSPLCCLVWPKPILTRAYALLSQQRGELLKIMTANRMDMSMAVGEWPEWIAESARWLQSVYRSHWLINPIPHEQLFSEWNRDPYSLN